MAAHRRQPIAQSRVCVEMSGVALVGGFQKTHAHVFIQYRMYRLRPASAAAARRFRLAFGTAVDGRPKLLLFEFHSCRVMHPTKGIVRCNNRTQY
jgi:hypothetical protein